MSEEEAADYLNFPYDRKSVNHFRPEQYAASDMPTVYSKFVQNTFSFCFKNMKTTVKQKFLSKNKMKPYSVYQHSSRSSKFSLQ